MDKTVIPHQSQAPNQAFGTGNHLFDRFTAERSVESGTWCCRCGASFPDLDVLISHIRSAGAA